MRLLLVKLSSLGDVVHSYPALTDAAAAVPGIEIDWLVDEAFAPLAALHPAVHRVITLPLRRLKKRPGATLAEIVRRIGEMRQERYDLVIDAQGLLKSALPARLAKAKALHGFARGSAREALATIFYAKGHDIPEIEPMATRIRRLFAAAIGYPMPSGPADAGLIRPTSPAGARPVVALLHGTSWKTKTWTREGWHELATRLGARGSDVLLFAHGETEAARAAEIAGALPHVRVIADRPLPELLPILASASAAVTVDTGLGHLAAAHGIPTVGLYGATNPGLTGLVGPRVVELTSRRSCAPCEKSRCAIRPDFGEGPPCLADRTAVEVLAALGRLLDAA